MKTMRVLDLSLKHRWYDMIASGEKTEEYREIKDFYFKRLNFEWRLHLEDGCYKGCIDFRHHPEKCAKCGRFSPYPYDAVRFHRGQGSPVTMLVECLGITIGKGKPEWGAPEDKEVFIIKLGKRL